MKPLAHIALVGNPNCGKSSLFNELTGLRQKVGNFPGVTVDKKTGTFAVSPGRTLEITDLPGTYSLYPKRADEWITYRVLLGRDETVRPDMVLVVADASNLRRNLLFCSQIIDLGLPVLIALTMNDIARTKGIRIDVAGLERELGVPVVEINPRKGKGLEALKKRMDTAILKRQATPRPFLYSQMLAPDAVAGIHAQYPGLGDYAALHHLIHPDILLTQPAEVQRMQETAARFRFNPVKTQAEEILQRYARIKFIMQQCVTESDPLRRSLFTEKLDRLLLHRIWGYLILLVVLFLLFQSVFWIAAYPMDLIDGAFASMTSSLSDALPAGLWTDLLINGILAGVGGILVFVPQIMILFGLITLLEDSGYMARISFLTDRVMRKAGLNGKSVMPMISAYACAVPAIMSARSIENRKERLLTILVTPLMSCSARLPVYTILIALVIPDTTYGGFISLQGLVMMGLYLFGTVMALLVASIFRYFITNTDKSYFILELPVYRSPRWKNVGLVMYEKARVFVTDAGKVIMIISLLLWTLSSFGPTESRRQVEEAYAIQVQQQPQEAERLIAEKKSALLRESYAGRIGSALEPVIAPLGYDWKIGIALITSFAAREVFVGTMATLYSVGEGAEESGQLLIQKMAAARRDDGQPVYTLATGVSLLLFYVLAMQCMSTLAVVRRETRSWTWPLVQLIYMTGLAYLFGYAAYRLLS